MNDPIHLPPEVQEAIRLFLEWDRILNRSGCMGGWGSRPPFERDINAGIVLAKFLHNVK